LRTTPARNPRTECACQPVASMMAVMVVPSGASGDQTAAGIAIFPIDSCATPLTVERAVLTNSARVWSEALIWPAGITAPQQAGAVKLLNSMGIVLR
jgi:hypothetical protein